MSRKVVPKKFYKEMDEEKAVECPPQQDENENGEEGGKVRAVDLLRESISNKGRIWKFVGAFLLLLIVLGVVLGIMLHPSKDTETFIPQDLIDFLSNASSDGGEALRTPSTPQNEALVWLANNPSLTNYTDQEKIQRYALATLYYSTKGENWTHDDNWLSNADVCDKWYSYKNPINCNSAGEIFHLHLYDNNLYGTIPAEIGLLSDSLGKFNIQAGMTLFNVSCLFNKLPVGQACHSCSDHFCHFWFSRVRSHPPHYR